MRDALALVDWTGHILYYGDSFVTGGNETSALLMAIPIKRTKVLICTINGFCSAVAGVVFSLYMLSGYGLHCQGMEMDVIAAVVIGGTLLAGGTSYVFGSVFGVLTLGIIQSLIMFDGTINSWWTRLPWTFCFWPLSACSALSLRWGQEERLGAVRANRKNTDSGFWWGRRQFRMRKKPSKSSKLNKQL